MKFSWYQTMQHAKFGQGAESQCKSGLYKISATPLSKAALGLVILSGAQFSQGQDEAQKDVSTVPTDETEIIEAIKETFPEAPEEAVAIAKCESQLDATALSPTEDVGLMQINLPSHKERLDELELDGFDIEDNLAYSRMLYEESGWEPWVCAEKLGITEEDIPTNRNG